jgi:hypothetical protein
LQHKKKGSSDKFGLKKRELENLSKPIISGAKNERQTRDKRERDETETKQRREAKAEIKQRQNKERTKKRGAIWATGIRRELDELDTLKREQNRKNRKPKTVQVLVL